VQAVILRQAGRGGYSTCQGHEPRFPVQRAEEAQAVFIVQMCVCRR
jgi:hypothetical protein